MLKAITALLLFQLAGEVTTRALALPIPGPVLGMLLLWLALTLRGTAPQSLVRVSGTLFANLSLLYVPAAVGILVQFPLIQQEWLPILVAVVLSTIITLVVSALTMRWLSARVHPAPLAEEVAQ